MGEDVRVPLPGEEGRRQWKLLLRPLFWVSAIALVLIGVFFVPHAFTEPRAATGVQIDVTTGAERPARIRSLDDKGPGKTVPAPGGVAAQVPTEGEALPPGTSTLPSLGQRGSGLSPLSGSGSAETSLVERLSTLISSDPDRYEGSPIAVYRGKIQHVVVGKSFAIGPSPVSYMWVVLPAAPSSEQREAWSGVIRAGQHVYVDGVLSSVPVASQARRTFGIENARDLEVGPSKLFISARAVEGFESP